MKAGLARSSQSFIMMSDCVYNVYLQGGLDDVVCVLRAMSYVGLSEKFH